MVCHYISSSYGSKGYGLRIADAFKLVLCIRSVPCCIHELEDWSRKYTQIIVPHLYIYIYIWFSQLEISIYKRVLENINEYKRFPIATFDYRRVFVSRLARCIPSAQFPWITMGSAVVTAQDYYDVSDTEAGSDDFAVRWGEKKMDAGHRWTLWTGPGVRMRGKTRTIE